ncbi:MAG: hypothetical protein V3V16_07205 [Melioribacteraceae bacterium]
MCQFNFLIIKENVKSQEIKEIVSNHELDFAQQYLDIGNINGIKAFSTAQWNNKAKNLCDCSSVLGKNHWNDTTEPYWKKEKKKLERKRYSKRRIELLMERKRQEYRTNKKDESQIEMEESKKWIDLLNDDRLKNKLSKIGILHHQFSGEIQNEKIKIENEQVISADNINIDFIKNIKEDELIWVNLH